MQKNNINKYLDQIARKHNTTVANVRSEIENAMLIAQANTDPAVQALWDSIPKKGSTITVDEFIIYVMRRMGY